MPQDNDIDRVMQALPPAARIALKTLSQAQDRPVEDVLRDAMRDYIAGRVPAVDIDSAMASIQTTAYRAGCLIGKLRRLSRQYGDDDE